MAISFDPERSQGREGSQFDIQISRTGVVEPLGAEIVNPTGLALNSRDELFVSSRHDGNIFRVSRQGETSIYAKGMGVATDIVFDREDNLYVGDRSGTIFKIDRKREIFVFATLEPSVSAYHLAFDQAGSLFVTGPTASTCDHVYKVTSSGEVEVFFTGLGRPQGLAFDAEGNLYVAASLAGRRGVVRINPDAEGQTGHQRLQPHRLDIRIRAGRVSCHDQFHLSIHVGVEGKPLPLTRARPGKIRQPHVPLLAARSFPHPMETAEIIAIGSELLTPHRVDSNSLYLTRQLNSIGIEVDLKVVAGDQETRLEQVVRSAVERSPLVIATGGLGPTEDDITRKVFARVLQRQMVLQHDILQTIRNRFRSRGLEMPGNNARQALVPVGARILGNRLGTAPGLWLEKGEGRHCSAPGSAFGNEGDL